MPHNSRAGTALLVIVAVLVFAGGCVSPEELARRQAEALVQTQQAALAQTAESLRLTAEAALKEVIPVPQQPAPPGQPQPGEALPFFTRLPVAGPTWQNGFGAINFTYEHSKTLYANTGGLHNGLDLGVKRDTPVYAGVIGVTNAGQTNDV